MIERDVITMDKILVVDDDPAILFAFRKALEKEGYRVISFTTGREAIKSVVREKPSLIFLDIAMPEMDGLAVMKAMREAGVNVPVVVITAFGNMETAIQAMKQGAFEYLTKPVDVFRVRSVTKNALEIRNLQDQVDQLRKGRFEPRDRYRLVGNSPVMYQLYKTIGTIASTPNSTNVLITGESGTGKELVARALHAYGEHCNAPFFGLNCTVLPEQLLTSELFGHEKGSFTGAVELKKGRFEAVDCGTVYLDEIGDTSLEFQRKLLRVLQEREFERLGSLSPIALKARIVASTNRDLKYKIKAEEFREDLYFRLSVLEITVPPLRERKEDIPLLVAHFLDKHCHASGNSPKEVSEEALDLLLNHDFPGNVRELENIIERCIYLAKGAIVTPETLSQMMTPAGNDRIELPIINNNIHQARRNIIELFDRRFIKKLLTENRGNVTAASRIAGIERQSFQRLMKKYDIRADEFRRG
jgi:two-component system response regulator AtoC